MKFLVVRSTNYVKFIEGCVICTEKQVLIKKCLQT